MKISGTEDSNKNTEMWLVSFPNNVKVPAFILALKLSASHSGPV
jgi:hypothetical protein